MLFHQRSSLYWGTYVITSRLYRYCMFTVYDYSNQMYLANTIAPNTYINQCTSL